MKSWGERKEPFPKGSFLSPQTPLSILQNVLVWGTMGSGRAMVLLELGSRTVLSSKEVIHAEQFDESLAREKTFAEPCLP